MNVDVKGRATNRAHVVTHAAPRYRVGVRAREDLRPDHAGTDGLVVVPPRRDRPQLDQVPRVIVSDGDRAIEGGPPIRRETRVVLEDEHGVEIALDAQFPESHVAERAPAHRRRAERAARGRDLLGERLFAVDGFEPLEVRRFGEAEVVDEVRAHRGPPLGVARHVDHEDLHLRMVIA